MLSDSRTLILAATMAWTSYVPLRAEELQLPPAVTPAVRAACEADVRRLCVDGSPTYAKVRDCVERRSSEFNMRCKVAAAAAGLWRGRVAGQ